MSSGRNSIDLSPSSPAGRLLLAVVLFVALVLTGTFGFMILADVAFFQALYFTVITLTAVGYEESFELTSVTRAFTMVVAVLGVGAITFAVVSGLDFIVDGHLRSLLGRRRMDRRIARLHGHTIVCGFGQVGRHVAGPLAAEGGDVVIVDPDPDRLRMAGERDFLYVDGDASREEVLRAAGIEDAGCLVACAHDDADNVLISLTARGLAPELTIVARVKNDENEAKARRAGANRVIAPAAIGGRRIAALVTRPAVVDFLDVVTHGGDVDVVLEELGVEAGDHLEGRSLRTLEMQRRYGATVVAVRSPDHGGPSMRPDPDRDLSAGDALVVIGRREDLDRLRRGV